MRGLRRELNLLEDSDFGIVNKKEISNMAEFVKNNNGKRNNNNRKPNNRQANNKNQNFNAKREVGITPPDVCAGTIEYKMPRLMAENILKDAKSKSGKLPKSAQEILCEYVNTQCGLKGYCVKVLVDLN